MNGSFKKYLIYSAAAHLAFFLILFFAPQLPFRESLHSPEKIIWINIPKGVGDKIGSGLKKAEGMPQTTIAEKKKPLAKEAEPVVKKPEMVYKKEPDPAEPKPQPKPEPPKPEVPQAQPKPKPKPKPKSEHDKKMAEALKRIATEANTRPPEAAQIPEEAEGGVEFGSTTGPFVSPDDPEYVLYQAKIRHRIMEAWVLPISMASGTTYSCTIIVRIDDSGRVIRTSFKQRSGNESFDQSALRAIHQASPLDTPPEKLKREAVGDGFLIEFDPEVKS